MKWGAAAWHVAFGVGAQRGPRGEHPRAVAFVAVFDAEVGEARAEGGAGRVAVGGGRGHACAEGAGVERVDDAACVCVAEECGLAG